MTRRLVVASLALAALTLTSPAAADPSRCPGAPRLDEQRIGELEAILERESRYLAGWRAAWTSGFAASAIGQVAAGSLVDEPRDLGLYVGAVKATVLALAVPLLAPRVDVPRPLEGQTRCQRLRQLRRGLARAAASERRGGAWVRHAGNLAIHAAGSLYLGLARDQWLQALVTGLVGSAVGELAILTQPRGAIRASGRSAGLRVGVTLGGGAVGVSLALPL